MNDQDTDENIPQFSDTTTLLLSAAHRVSTCDPDPPGLAGQVTPDRQWRCMVCLRLLTTRLRSATDLSRSLWNSHKRRYPYRDFQRPIRGRIRSWRGLTRAPGSRRSRHFPLAHPTSRIGPEGLSHQCTSTLFPLSAAPTNTLRAQPNSPTLQDSIASIVPI